MYGTVINNIDLDGTLLETMKLGSFNRHLLFQQLVDERPELSRGKAFVDSHRLLVELGPTASEIGRHDSFTVALQNKYGLPDDWAEKNLENRLDEIRKFIKATFVPLPELNNQLLRLEQLGHTNVLATHNYPEVAHACLEATGLAERFGDRVVGRHDIGDKKTGLPVVNLVKRFGRFTHRKFYEDVVNNLLWPYVSGAECWLISSKVPEEGAFHHRCATIGEAFETVLAQAA